MYKCRHSYYRI